MNYMSALSKTLFVCCGIFALGTFVLLFTDKFPMSITLGCIFVVLLFLAWNPLMTSASERRSNHLERLRAGQHYVHLEDHLRMLKDMRANTPRDRIDELDDRISYIEAQIVRLKEDVPNLIPWYSDEAPRLSY